MVNKDEYKSLRPDLRCGLFSARNRPTDDKPVGMPKQSDCRRRTTTYAADDGGASARGKPDEMIDPSKLPPPSSLDSVIVPTPLDSSLQHSHFRQLTNCIQDIEEVCNH